MLHALENSYGYSQVECEAGRHGWKITAGTVGTAGKSGRSTEEKTYIDSDYSLMQIGNSGRNLTASC